MLGSVLKAIEEGCEDIVTSGKFIKITWEIENEGLKEAYFTMNFSIIDSKGREYKSVDLFLVYCWIPLDERFYGLQGVKPGFTRRFTEIYEITKIQLV